MSFFMLWQVQCEAVLQLQCGLQMLSIIWPRKADEEAVNLKWTSAGISCVLTARSAKMHILNLCTTQVWCQWKEQFDAMRGKIICYFDRRITIIFYCVYCCFAFFPPFLFSYLPEHSFHIESIFTVSGWEFNSIWESK